MPLAISVVHLVDCGLLLPSALNINQVHLFVQNAKLSHPSILKPLVKLMSILSRLLEMQLEIFCFLQSKGNNNFRVLVASICFGYNLLYGWNSKNKIRAGRKVILDYSAAWSHFGN